MNIPVDSLPAAILSYISSNYAAYTTVHAEIDTICPEGAVYEIFINDPATGSKMKLFFDTSYNFLMTGERILYADISQAAKDFIANNYSSYTPRMKSVKFTLATGAIQYVVYLKNGSLRKMVRVADDGTFVCEQ